MSGLRSPNKNQSRSLLIEYGVGLLGVATPIVMVIAGLLTQSMAKLLIVYACIAFILGLLVGVAAIGLYRLTVSNCWPSDSVGWLSNIKERKSLWISGLSVVVLLFLDGIAIFSATLGAAAFFVFHFLLG